MRWPIRREATRPRPRSSLGYVLLWWIYALIAKGSQDIHFDMGEVVSWSLIPAYGYPKHPPFPAWVAAAWFAVFPYADWAFYLLSTVSIGIALWFVWLIAARYVDGHKRALALALLMFSPGFNFQPLKFNSNALLIPVWAAASYCFLRSFAERSLLWGVIAGVAAAIAMLTKYWSIFLILGFIAAALAHPKRWDYLRSPAPWASVVAGAMVFAPNIVSIFAYDFRQFGYATGSHTVTSLRRAARFVRELLRRRAVSRRQASRSSCWRAGRTPRPCATCCCRARRTGACWRSRPGRRCSRRS